jgi:hypothetical protein
MLVYFFVNLSFLIIKTFNKYPLKKTKFLNVVKIYKFNHRFKHVVIKILTNISVKILLKFSNLTIDSHMCLSEHQKNVPVL